MKMQLTSFSLLILLSTTSTGLAQTTTGMPQTATKPSTPATVGTSGTVATPPSAAAISADYKLVPGDKLRIEVYKDAQLSQSLQVRPDGKITLPLAGDIAAAGRTPTELRDSITTSLKTYINNPTVTVIVTETVPPVFYVSGEVNSPGSFPLNGQIDILQALAMAGGFKDFANTKNIMIRRGSQTLRFNYKDAVKGEEKVLVLKPGDTIIVP